MSQTAGRYDRSFKGLVIAMVITVGIVLAFVGFRSLVREDFVLEPESIDYLATVAQLQEGEIEVVYPGTLPAGWIATNVRVGEAPPGSGPDIAFSLLTDDEEFVGVRQENANVGAVVAEFIDTDAEATGTYVASTPAPVAGGEWEGWAIEGGDRGYTASLPAQTLLVFGSATDEELRTVIDSLTTAPVR